MMEGKLKEAFLGMKRQEAIDLVEKVLRSGTDTFAVLKECREAMEEVGKRFETGGIGKVAVIVNDIGEVGMNSWMMDPVITYNV